MTTLDPPPPVRLSWDEWGMAHADTSTLRANCTRRKVGAYILAADGRVVGSGYNGAPPGKPGCLTDGACPRGRATTTEVAHDAPYLDGAAKCTALHAEENAIIFRERLDLTGCTLYITCPPCPNCERLIRGTRLARVVWRGQDGTLYAVNDLWDTPLEQPFREAAQPIA